ncbi:hypothetical protein QCA50_011784 [Cerrena zonata]|uniref:Aminoglycoside phosphotransferase domain-containing protein n=1 Tax=Cerrena zonata TaxID=2478898 RepID=A0AAW0G0R2_9APHY
MLLCSIPNCNKFRVRRTACVLCQRCLCLEHLKPQFHTCPSYQIEEQEDAYFEGIRKAQLEEFDRLRSTLDFVALRERASSLKGGTNCSIPFETSDSPVHDMVGGMNYHFPILFEDGVTWICRVRRQSPPPELQDAIIESEVATMRFLASIGVPVPKVHDFSVHINQGSIGMPYILMDMVKGRPLDWNAASEAAKEYVLEQLADIFICLSQHPFPSIGCLYPSDDTSLKVGPLTFDDHVDQNSDGTLSLLGPFTDWQSYLRALIKRNLQFILDGKAYTDARVDAYLVHLTLRDSLPALATFCTHSDGEFFLKHMDDKGDHILIDDSFKIVSIIDWEWAQLVPKPDAFAAPLFLLDIGQYYDGNNQLSTHEILFAKILEDKGRRGLAHAVMHGRVHHRIAHCIGGDVDNLDDFPKLFSGLQEFILAETDWSIWKESALKKYRLDTGLQNLLLAL